MKVEFDDFFWCSETDEKSRVFQLFPSVFGDSRGFFVEQWKLQDDVARHWFHRENWIRQINTSCSHMLTIRGCHAQSGKYCQAKMVFAQTANLYDFIIDARPDSRTFGKSKVYLLDSKLQNKLFVPRGFLHSFITTDEDTKFLFTYFCDNVYSKGSEISVNPSSIVPNKMREYLGENNLDDFLSSGDLDISDKDRNSIKLDDFLCDAQETWKKGTLWYK